MAKVDYTREEIIALCDKAIFDVAEWSNRDHPQAMIQVGKCWALLKAGCQFKVITEDPLNIGIVTNEKIVYLEVWYPVFGDFENDTTEDPKHSDNFYIPVNANNEWWR
jgi:hypothetical protein